MQFLPPLQILPSKVFQLLYPLPELLLWHKQLNLDIRLLSRKLPRLRILPMPRFRPLNKLLAIKAKGGRGLSR